MKTKTSTTKPTTENQSAKTPIPDDDTSAFETPLFDWSRPSVRGLTTMSPRERANAIEYLKTENAKAAQKPPPLPKSAPPREIRYAREDMDATVRRCARATPQSKECGAPFKMTDYPVGYYPFKEQIQKNSYVDTCPACEIKALKRLLTNPDDEYSRLSLEADLKFIQEHHNARINP